MRVRKTLSLTAISLFFMAKAALAQDVCPSAGKFLPIPISSDTAVSNAGTEDTGGGIAESSCRGGGTGWHATRLVSGTDFDVMVSCFHVLGKSGHAVSPDISSRSCILFNGDPAYCTGGGLLPHSCTKLVEDGVTTELGMIQIGYQPQPQPAANLDDLSFSVTKNSGKMVPALQNIPGAIGAPMLTTSLGLPVTYNGATSCHQHGVIKFSSTSGCQPNGGACFANIISVTITAAHGDSGSLVVTDDGANHPVGMLFAGTAGSGIADLIPIAQVMTDGKFDTVAGSSPGFKTAQLSSSEVAVKAVIGHNQWITKLPHVKNVTYGLVGNDVTIVVQVDKAKNIKAVETKVPPRLQGFPVDVEEVPTINYL
jgi:hypothetical protein